MSTQPRYCPRPLVAMWPTRIAGLLGAFGAVHVSALSVSQLRLGRRAGDDMEATETISRSVSKEDDLALERSPLYLHGHQLEVARGDLGDGVLSKEVETRSVFSDVTRMAFPKQWYAWNHSGFPRSHQGTPSFPDFNGDGLLDYFYHNHYEAHPNECWDIGLAIEDSHFSNQFYETVGHDVFVHTEPEGSKWKDPEPAMDSHGTAVLDIDRDGVLDLYMATGGGDGYVGGACKFAVLLWGETGDKGDKVPTFVGGRDAAEAANLHNPESRGRMNYFVDFNGDGLLDIVFVNEPRSDGTHAPGYAMVNLGNRHFKAHRQLTEYTETLVLHDADGDGRAEELVVQRRDCAVKNCGYTGDKQCKELKQLNREWYNFCLSHPEGSTAVYKFDHSDQELKLISPPVSSTEIGSDTHATSMQTGDFDGDGLADLVVLYFESIKFYYSSHRSPGALPIGKASEEITWHKTDCEGQALRAVDLDNDGILELLVLCFNVQPTRGPAHKLYSRWSSDGRWTQEDDSGLGSILDASLVHPTSGQVKDLCSSGASGYIGYMRKICGEFQDPSIDGHLKTPRSMGMSVVDFDNDGFSDVVVSYDIGNMLMFKNNLKDFRAKGHQFLAVKLKGTRSNEYGVGATVLLTASGMGNRKETLVLLREVYSASHETDWLGTRDDRIIFGLGPHGVPERLEIRWPGKGAKVQIISDKDLLRRSSNSMQDLLMIEEDR
mmetsp:Transcript_11143/g.29644  ORF Transcript_11143/g.29644 Transcript_11143/m.29644 type:complete len:718 (+) Transcript_11143:75-2228(+)